MTSPPSRERSRADGSTPKWSARWRSPPDPGKALLTGSWNPERTMKVLDVVSGKELRTLPTTLFGINCLRGSPETKARRSWCPKQAGEQAAMGRFQVRDVETGDPACRRPAARWAEFCSWRSPRTAEPWRSAAAPSQSGEVSLWDTTNWQLQARFPVFRSRVEGVAFSRDGRRLAAAGKPDAQPGRRQGMGPGCGSAARHLDGAQEYRDVRGVLPGWQSPRHGRATAHVVLLWDAATVAAQLAVLKGHTDAIRCVLPLSPDGQERWPRRAGTTPSDFGTSPRGGGGKASAHGTHPAGDVSPAFSPDQASPSVSVSWDRIVKVWDVAKGTDVPRSPCRGRFGTSGRHPTARPWPRAAARAR